MKQPKIFNLDDLKSASEEAEFIPLMTQEDENEIEKESLPKALPILPLRNMVLFPGVVIPISAGRDKSIKLILDAYNGDRVIGVVSQKNESVEEPSLKDIHTVGTVAHIIRVLKMPEGNITVILQGKRRFSIKSIEQETPYLSATIERLKEKRPSKKNEEFSAIIDSIKELAIEIIKKNPNIPTEATIAIQNIESSHFLMNFVSSNMNLNLKDKQRLLEISDLKKRALETLTYMNTEYQKLELRNNIQSKVRSDLDQQQREYFLNQQMKTIQEELGQVSYEAEVQEMRTRSKTKKWNKKTGEHFEKELLKLQRMNPQVAEYSTQRNYLELFLDLPWNFYSKDKLDIKRAERILNQDHYGLEDSKKRVLEYLSVLKLRQDMKSPILCFYGPPGVGKTSLGKSIARAIGRKYIRMSLGGLRDEAEIRGHRKTYIGAMPGRILHSIKKVGTSNPVFVLDEIDKVSSGGYNGDPASAMLEVLDPEQNTEFYDNFLEVDYDLSKVMFIATANNLSTIHPALRDRMEIIEISGYTTEEKVQIAKIHLLTKQLKEHGLNKNHVKIYKPLFTFMIDRYTRESGVRGLEKQIAKVVRYVAKCIATEKPYNITLKKSDIISILGHPKIFLDESESNEVAGIVTGLAWTSFGGDILFIESSLSQGKGDITLTGNLGKVMKESATIAMQYLKSNIDTFKISKDVLKNYNAHVHVPEGATPKDGPSAGVAMLTSLVSSFTQRKVKKHLAMTGEITLRGKVLPVGGIKEKILAAKRAKIKEVILCESNRKDVEEIKPSYLNGLKFHYVRQMSEVIDIGLTKQKVKNTKLFI